MFRPDVIEEAYRRLAGEVEARATQQRLNFSQADRQQRPPWLAYDVPEHKQIVTRAAVPSSIAEILRRYGLAGLMAGGAAASARSQDSD